MGALIQDIQATNNSDSVAQDTLPVPLPNTTNSGSSAFNDSSVPAWQTYEFDPPKFSTNDHQYSNPWISLKGTGVDVVADPAMDYAPIVGGQEIYPSNDGFDITTRDVVRTIADFVPFVGSGWDIVEGIQTGDGWMVAAGVGFLILDVATLGGSSLIKGAVKTIGKGVIRSGKVLGKTQRTGTRGHAFTSRIIGLRYALDPRVERVTYDLGYKKLLGKGNFKYGPRPDVGVLFKNGRVKAFLKLAQKLID